MPDENDGQAAAEPVAEVTATPVDTVPISAYKTLQRELQVVKDENKKYKGEPSLEEQLQVASEERTRLQHLLEAAEAKSKAPEIGSLVDKFVEKHGIVPDPELIEEMRKLAQSSGVVARPETSGMRNAPAASPAEKEAAAIKSILEKENLW